MCTVAFQFYQEYSFRSRETIGYPLALSEIVHTSPQALICSGVSGCQAMPGTCIISLGLFIRNGGHGLCCCKGWVTEDRREPLSPSTISWVSQWASVCSVAVFAMQTMLASNSSSSCLSVISAGIRGVYQPPQLALPCYFEWFAFIIYIPNSHICMWYKFLGFTD